jgi:hypothetical protein
VEPTRLQNDRKAKERLAEKHINRRWEKELEGFETYCQGQEKVVGSCRQPMFLMERQTLLLLLLLLLMFDGNERTAQKNGNSINTFHQSGRRTRNGGS